MRLKRPYIATLDRVRISRGENEAIIEYADPHIRITHFRLGPVVATMTDQEILDRFNEHIEAVEQLRTEYEHVAVEIPPGRPQIQYFAPGDQWTPRGDVLRCVIDDGGPEGEPVVHVDDRELSWREFGRLLTTHAGWGMRIVFVPDDETHIEPPIEVREPREDER